mmetsp:Transcript_106424/g.185143  ORF Transcript_106424/g.185143 Transcript_106424/m.185143 type:complete len:145 (+) Transcript_106424:1795-2229(+)
MQPAEWEHPEKQGGNPENCEDHDGLMEGVIESLIEVQRGSQSSCHTVGTGFANFLHWCGLGLWEQLDAGLLGLNKACELHADENDTEHCQKLDLNGTGAMSLMSSNGSFLNVKHWNHVMTLAQGFSSKTAGNTAILREIKRFRA